MFARIIEIRLPAQMENVKRVQIKFNQRSHVLTTVVASDPVKQHDMAQSTSVRCDVGTSTEYQTPRRSFSGKSDDGGRTSALEVVSGELSLRSLRAEGKLFTISSNFTLRPLSLSVYIFMCCFVYFARQVRIVNIIWGFKKS